MTKEKLLCKLNHLDVKHLQNWRVLDKKSGDGGHKPDIWTVLYAFFFHLTWGLVFCRHMPVKGEV